VHLSSVEFDKARSITTPQKPGVLIRGGRMPEWAWLIAFVCIYLVLVRWVLPKLGVPT
jgi:hypothetical protein